MSLWFTNSLRGTLPNPMRHVHIEGTSITFIHSQFICHVPLTLFLYSHTILFHQGTHDLKMQFAISMHGGHTMVTLTPSPLNFPMHFTIPQKKHFIKSPTRYTVYVVYLAVWQIFIGSPNLNYAVLTRTHEIN